MYVPLYIKTHYSILSSLIKIDELMLFAKKHNFTSLGICDDSLTGIMEFYDKCLLNNIKPIIGLDLKLQDINLLLFCKNENGYKNLVKIESLFNKESTNFNDITKYLDDLLIIIPYIDKEKRSLLQNYNYYVGVSSKEEETITDAPTVYINKILFFNENDYKYLSFLKLIKDNKTIDEVVYDKSDNFFKTNNINISSTSLENTNIIANLCNIKLEDNILHMPKYNTLEPFNYLKALAYKGLMKRLSNNIDNKYQTRLEYELKVIEEMNFSNYFLVVYDFIKYAKQNNILVGPGRGSAASSLVSYAIGITEVDPIKYGLLFERFLNKYRKTYPDIDTDFPFDKRDNVIGYVVKKYKKENVANIITFNTFLLKASIRDLGKVLKIENSILDYLCKDIYPKESYQEFINRNIEIRNYINSNKKLLTLFDIVKKIEGIIKNTSTHAAGIVISDIPLYNIVPVSKNLEINQTEFSMEYLERFGLIKMDFLGIKNLTLINKIISSINNNINFYNFPIEEKVIEQIFANGDTLGIFQFESAGMRRFLKDLCPHSFNELCDAMALYRPGPLDNISLYIKRKQGKEPIIYLDKRLEPILKDTLGIIIYQEQILLIAQKIANYSLGEADILRRAMSKKKYELLINEENKFISRAIEYGCTKEVSKEIFTLILKFAGYGFNKAHAVSYSLVAYNMAYLKYYYKSQFYACLLTQDLGSNMKIKEYINELRKNNITLLTPNINKSTNCFIVENNNILCPLTFINNISNQMYEIINKNKYNSFLDFLEKTGITNKDLLENLIFASVFDEFNINKRTLIENLDSFLNYFSLQKDVSVKILMPEINYFDEYDENILMEKEKEIFGFYIKTHKTEKYKLRQNNIIDLNKINNYLDKFINLIVMIEKIKKINTKNNKEMAFINVSDNTSDGLLICYQENLKLLENINKNDVVKIFGKVEKRYSEYQIIISKLEKCGE